MNSIEAVIKANEINKEDGGKWRYLAQDNDGDWHLYTYKPELQEADYGKYFYSEGATVTNCRFLGKGIPELPLIELK